MSPTASVRAAGPADIEALVRTRVEMFRELGRGPSAADEASFRAACRQGLERQLRDGTAVAWVCGAPDGRVSGSAILLIFPRLPSPVLPGTAEGYLLNVYVSPERRRQGLASALVAAAVEESRRRGLARIRLHATPAARSVYAGAGFRGREDEMELVPGR